MAEDVKDEVYRNYRFKLDFGGSRNGAFFTSIRSQGVKISTIDYRTGGGTVYKLPGHYTVSPIICEWGVTANLEMWNWMKSAKDGKPDYKNISITILNLDGTESNAPTWNYTGAWPSEWRGAELVAGGNDIAIESMVLQAYDVERAN